MDFIENIVVDSPFKNKNDIENELKKEFRKIRKSGGYLEESEIEVSCLA